MTMNEHGSFQQGYRVWKLFILYMTMIELRRYTITNKSNHTSIIQLILVSIKMTDKQKLLMIPFIRKKSTVWLHYIPKDEIIFLYTVKYVDI